MSFYTAHSMKFNLQSEFSYIAKLLQLGQLTQDISSCPTLEVVVNRFNKNFFKINFHNCLPAHKQNLYTAGCNVCAMCVSTNAHKTNLSKLEEFKGNWIRNFFRLNMETI
jgi:hypothetical protein